MTTRKHNRTLLGKVTILAALGVTSFALIAASPADAIYRSYEPIESEAPVPERVMAQDDTTGKASCSLTLSTGQTIVYAHGYSFSVVNKATGKTHTFTCQDGKWVETVNSTAPTRNWDHLYEADQAYVDGSGELTLVNPHEGYAYTSDNGFYAEP
jgi:hypothetical protein